MADLRRLHPRRRRGPDPRRRRDRARDGSTSPRLRRRPRTADVDDYTVTIDGDLTAGSSSDLTVSVERDGEPVTDLEPYLGAFGHLVALRAGDLAYLHVHPEDCGPGPDVPFVAEVPSAGDFHLYFDFQHDGVVRTARVLRPAGGDHDDDH